MRVSCPFLSVRKATLRKWECMIDITIKGRELVGNVGEQAEARLVLGHPGGVDDDERGGGRKQAAHVGVVSIVLDEVVDDVEAQRKVGLVASCLPNVEESLAGVVLKQSLALRNGHWADIKAGVGREAEVAQLVAVATAQLQHRFDAVLGHELVEHAGLELGQVVVGARAGVAALRVAVQPVGLGGGEGPGRE
nr:hypothetical protein [Tanacetum cinerariifolium]